MQNISKANQALINLNRAFSPVLQTLSKDANVRFGSMVGLMSAIAPIMIAAKGDTAAQFTQAVHPGVCGQNMATALADIAKQVQALPNSEQFSVSSKSNIWVMDGFELAEDYVQQVKQIFRLEPAQLNFADSAKSVEAINNWFKQPMVTEDSINADTRLVSGNIAKINAAWKRPFDETTNGGIFNLADGGYVSAQMMSVRGPFAVVDDANFKAVLLPLDGPGYVVAILPNENVHVDEVERFLSGDALQQLCADLKGAELNKLSIDMPAFSAEYEIDGTQLKRLGVQDLFNGRDCDLSGMTGEPNGIYVSLFKQSSRMTVTPSGIQQEAASVAVCGLESMYHGGDIIFNRPFILKTMLKLPNADIEYFSATVYKPEIKEE